LCVRNDSHWTNIMELTVEFDGDQIDSLVKTSLIEYHQYLYKAEWLVDQNKRKSIRDAMLIVLEQYMSPLEYENYIASLLN